jgi:hypothetical protein
MRSLNQYMSCVIWIYPGFVHHCSDGAATCYSRLSGVIGLLLMSSTCDHVSLTSRFALPLSTLHRHCNGIPGAFLANDCSQPTPSTKTICFTSQHLGSSLSCSLAASGTLILPRDHSSPFLPQLCLQGLLCCFLSLLLQKTNC